MIPPSPDSQKYIWSKLQSTKPNIKWLEIHLNESSIFNMKEFLESSCSKKQKYFKIVASGTFSEAIHEVFYNKKGFKSYIISKGTNCFLIFPELLQPDGNLLLKFMVILTYPSLSPMM